MNSEDTADSDEMSSLHCDSWMRKRMECFVHGCDCCMCRKWYSMDTERERAMEPKGGPLQLLVRSQPEECRSILWAG